MNSLIEGLKIIEKYDPNFDTVAEHDIVYAGDDTLPISDEDKKRLDDLGWFTQEDSWACFV